MANNPQVYRNTRDDLPFQFLGVTTLLRATADTTHGAFGLIEHPMLPPGFESPTMFITVKTNLFMYSRDAWHSCATASGSPPDRATSCSVPRIFRTASRLQARRPLRCCCWCRPAALSDSRKISANQLVRPPRRRTSQSSWRWQPTTGLTSSAHCRKEHPSSWPSRPRPRRVRLWSPT